MRVQHKLYIKIKNMYNYTAGKSLKHPVILPRLQCPYVLPSQQLNYVGGRLRHCLHPAWKRWSSPHVRMRFSIGPHLSPQTLEPSASWSHQALFKIAVSSKLSMGLYASLLDGLVVDVSVPVSLSSLRMLNRVRLLTPVAASVRSTNVEYCSFSK